MGGGTPPPDWRNYKGKNWDTNGNGQLDGMGADGKYAPGSEGALFQAEVERERNNPTPNPDNPNPNNPNPNNPNPNNKTPDSGSGNKDLGDGQEDTDQLLKDGTDKKIKSDENTKLQNTREHVSDMSVKINNKMLEKIAKNVEAALG